MRSESISVGNVDICYRCIFAQMWRKYYIYFTFASSLVPRQINKFCYTFTLDLPFVQRQYVWFNVNLGWYDAKLFASSERNDDALNLR